MGSDVVQQVGGAGLTAQRDLLQAGELHVAAARFGEQEAPVRGGRADAGDSVGKDGVEPVLRLARKGSHEGRPAGEDVQQDLNAGELLRSVSEQPALVGLGLDLLQGLAEHTPVVSRRLGCARGAGGPDHERLGTVGWFGAGADFGVTLERLDQEFLRSDHLKGRRRRHRRAGSPARRA